MNNIKMTTVNNFKKTNLLPDMESFKNPDNFMSKNLKRVNSLPNMESPQNSDNPSLKKSQKS